MSARREVFDVTERGLFGPFAREVSVLADSPDEVIELVQDRDMRECALQLKAARRVAAINYRRADR